MAVIRVNKNKNYTTISNTPLQDTNLSWRAKGLLAQMLSYPDDWEFSVTGLAAVSKESERAARTVLSELEEAGYLIRTQEKDKNGRFTKVVFDIFEEPQKPQKNEENQGLQPVDKKAHADTRDADSATQKNTNIKQNTNNTCKKEGQATYNDILDEHNLDPKVRDAMIEFIKMRKLLKKPLTNYALKDLINKLMLLSEGNPQLMIKILNNSIRNSWPDIYIPLADKDPEAQSKPAFLNFAQHQYDFDELEKVLLNR